MPDPPPSPDPSTSTDPSASPDPLARRVSAWLAGGVWSAAALLLTGLLAWMALTPDVWHARPDAAGLVLRPGLAATFELALATAGLLILILTPPARAVMVMVTCWRSGERLLAAFSAVVVLLLMLSVVLGLLWR
ncbi:MAG: DUF1634 domain-containing protein [Tepidisphaerales bacterium]